MTNPKDELDALRTRAPLDELDSMATRGAAVSFTEGVATARQVGVLSVGDVLDAKFLIVRQLGNGATGIVYEAIEIVTQARYAIKILHPELVQNASSIRSLRSEIAISQAVTHQNLLKVNYLAEQPGRAYIVMEYLDGADLRVHLQQRGGRLPLQEAITIASQIAAGLDYLHDRGFLHLDVKPQNVFVTNSGDVRVVDFGIAKALRAETQPGVEAGTLAYMAPEQLRREKVDRRADIYAFGLTFAEMCSGGLPFDASDGRAVLAWHLDVLHNLDTLELEEGVLEACELAIQHEPSARPARCHDVVERCRAALPNAQDFRKVDSAETSQALRDLEALRPILIQGLTKNGSYSSARDKCVATRTGMRALTDAQVTLGVLLKRIDPNAASTDSLASFAKQARTVLASQDTTSVERASVIVRSAISAAEQEARTADVSRKQIILVAIISSFLMFYPLFLWWMLSVRPTRVRVAYVRRALNELLEIRLPPARRNVPVRTVPARSSAIPSPIMDRATRDETGARRSDQLTVAETPTRVRKSWPIAVLAVGVLGVVGAVAVAASLLSAGKSRGSRGNAGDPCRDDGLCSASTYCVGGTCYRGNEGDPCSSEARCGGSNYCAEEKCYRGNEGDPCSAEGQCASSNYCSEGKCYRGNTGDPCSADRRCSSSNHCISGTCVYGTATDDDEKKPDNVTGQVIEVQVDLSETSTDEKSFIKALESVDAWEAFAPKLLAETSNRCKDPALAEAFAAAAKGLTVQTIATGKLKEADRAFYGGNDDSQALALRTSQLYEKLCDKGEAIACAEFGERLYDSSGWPAKSDRDRGKKLFERSLETLNAACARDDGRACKLLGSWYISGMMASPVEGAKTATNDARAALPFFVRGCGLKFASACSFLAVALAKADSDQMSECEPVGIDDSLMYAGCRAGSGAGCANLGRLFHAYSKRLPVSEALPIHFLKKACELTSGRSCAELGLLEFFGGSGIDDDKKFEGARIALHLGNKPLGDAPPLFLRACNLGSANGCRVLASMYEDGVGVDSDIAAAAKYYQQACEYGSDEACHWKAR